MKSIPEWRRLCPPLLLALALSSLGAWGAGEDTTPIVKQLPKKEPKIIYKKKTAINFEDAVIEGQVENPEGVYLVSSPDKKFGSLLKLRPNFHRELMRDALLLK